jgi:nucleoside-diphosphate-sugar epimerase
MRRAFADDAQVLFHAAGVSNSGCGDPREFERDRNRITQAIGALGPKQVFVYPSTCSVHDPDARTSEYVAHKLAMEDIVRQSSSYVILRLPQLAGHTPNPHTLLNYLHARIARGERFELWRNATRNVIDADDAAIIARHLLDNVSARNQTINIASPRTFAISEIVASMEAAVGKAGIYDIVDRGAHYDIDVAPIRDILASMDLRFGANYLDNVLRKYYTNGFRDSGY